MKANGIPMSPALALKDKPTEKTRITPSAPPRRRLIK